MYNRFYLDPHITKDLAGTQVKYNYRNQKLTIDLDMDHYAISNGQFKIISKTNFGFFSSVRELLYFSGSINTVSLKVKTTAKRNLTIDIKMWTPDQMSWTQSSKDINSNQLTYHVNGVKHNSFYTILINGKILKRIKSNMDGSLIFDYAANKNSDEIIILNR
jgi:hypothetical protein